MTKHLVDAININRQRKPLYAQLTNNKSNTLSNFLLSLEGISLPTALALDRWANYWQKKGIPILIYEFVDMEKTPAFIEKFQFNINSLSVFPSYNTNYLVKDLKRQLKNNRLEFISRLASNAINDLSQHPHLNCMTRHLLESCARCAQLALLHQDKAKELNLNFNNKLSEVLLHLHFLSFGTAQLIDKMAFPFQNDGIPIIYQDIPIVDFNLKVYP
jgi:hypothetical protein